MYRSTQQWTLRQWCSKGHCNKWGAQPGQSTWIEGAGNTKCCIGGTENICRDGYVSKCMNYCISGEILLLAVSRQVLDSQIHHDSPKPRNYNPKTHACSANGQKSAHLPQHGSVTKRAPPSAVCIAGCYNLPGLHTKQLHGSGQIHASMELNIDTGGHDNGDDNEYDKA